MDLKEVIEAEMVMVEIRTLIVMMEIKDMDMVEREVVMVVVDLIDITVEDNAHSHIEMHKRTTFIILFLMHSRCSKLCNTCFSSIVMNI